MIFRKVVKRVDSKSYHKEKFFFFTLYLHEIIGVS